MSIPACCLRGARGRKGWPLVSLIFIDFHNFLSIFTIFIDFHDLRTFVAIYILSRFTHFFRKFFLVKIASPQHHSFFACMAKPYTISLRSPQISPKSLKNIPRSPQNVPKSPPEHPQINPNYLRITPHMMGWLRTLKVDRG